jgi:hypothetical protein
VVGSSRAHPCTIKCLCQDLFISNLYKFVSGDWILSDIVTGHEGCFYHRKIESKQSSKVWLPKGEAPRTIVERRQLEKKTMFVVFFMTTGLLLIHYLVPGTSIDSVYYRDVCLKR